MERGNPFNDPHGPGELPHGGEIDREPKYNIVEEQFRPEVHEAFLKEAAKPRAGNELDEATGLTREQHEYIARARSAAAAASRWWEAVLVGGPKQDNGEPSAIQELLKQVDNKVSPYFAAMLEAKIDKFGIDYIDVDYDPCVLLHQVAEESGSNILKWPWKTGMWMEQGKVVVRYGYGAEDREVWSAPQDE